MNALFFGKHDEEEEKSNEFEMLEQQSIEINALSAEEVRALIAALERKEAGSSDGETQSEGGGGESAGVEEQAPLPKEDQKGEIAGIQPPETEQAQENALPQQLEEPASTVAETSVEETEPESESIDETLAEPESIP